MRVRILLPALLIPLSACGTLFYGKKQVISVESDPPGCTVVLNQQQLGVTPCQIKLDRRAPYQPGVHFGARGHYDLTLTREGYLTQQVVIVDSETRSSDTALLDCFLGPFCLFGMTVDKFEGQWDHLTPNAVQVTMLPEHGMPVPRSTLAPAGHWEPVPASATPTP